MSESPEDIERKAVIITGSAEKYQMILLRGSSFCFGSILNPLQLTLPSAGVEV